MRGCGRMQGLLADRWKSVARTPERGRLARQASGRDARAPKCCGRAEKATLRIMAARTLVSSPVGPTCSRLLELLRLGPKAVGLLPQFGREGFREIFRLGERTVDHRPARPREPDAGALRAGAQPLGRKQNARFDQLLVVLAHFGE